MQISFLWCKEWWDSRKPDGDVICLIVSSSNTHFTSHVSLMIVSEELFSFLGNCVLQMLHAVHHFIEWEEGQCIKLSTEQPKAVIVVVNVCKFKILILCQVDCVR